MRDQSTKPDFFSEHIIQSLQTGIVVLDRALNIEKANQWILEKLPDLEAIKGLHCFSAFKNREIPCDNCPVIKTFETGESHRQILYNPFNKGEALYYEVNTFPITDNNGEVTHVIENYTDISHLKRVEQEFQETAEKYRSLYDNAPQAYQSLNSKGYIIDINPAWLNILGYERNEVIGKWFGDFLHPDYVEHFRKNFPVFKRQGCIHDVQFQLLKKDKTKVYVSYEGRIGFDADGKVTQTYCTFKDITKEKEAEGALLKHKTILEEAEQLANIGGFEWDIPKGEMTVSEGWQKIHGINKSVLKIEALLPIAHPDDRRTIEKALSEALNKTKPYNLEHRIIKQTNKEIRIIKTRGRTVFDKDDQPLKMYGSVNDITEGKKARQAAKESEKRFKDFFNKIVDPIFIHDSQDGKIIEASTTALEKYGYSQTEIVTLKARDLNTPEKAEEVAERLKTIHEEGHFLFETIHQTKYGKAFPVEVHVHLIHYKNRNALLSVCRDITKRKTDEIKLREINTDLQLAQKIASIGNWQFNPEKGVPLWSDEIYNIYDREKSAGPPHIDEYKQLYEPDQYAKFTQAISLAITKGIGYDIVLKFKSPVSGKNKWIRAICQPNIAKRTRKGYYLQGTIQDITKAKETEIELLHAKEKAEEANQLKPEFLNNISHEVRTPMNGIIGFSEMLNKPGLNEKKRKFFTQIIQNSSHQLLKIIDAILEISTLETKQEKVKETAFCLNEVLLDLKSIFSLKANKKNVPIYVKTALADKKSTIITDRTKLTKVLSNLFANAVKFTAKGSIEVGYYIEKSRIILYVKDTGIGIAPENHRIIFERFSQEEKDLSRKYGGLGLGLSITKENVMLLGGDIKVTSEKGKGATFYVTIPYKTIGTQEAANEHKISNRLTKNAYKILIAEDEEINFLYIKTLFDENSNYNCQLLHAKNGKEAVDICSKEPNIDLILMDIKMPEMNGLEATQRIKKQCPKIKVIAQTAYSSDADKQLAYQYGCSGFLTKPINEDELFKTLNKHLGIKSRPDGQTD